MSFPMFADLVIRIGVQIVNKPEERSCAWTDGTSIFINEPIINELRYGTPERNVIHEFDSLDDLRAFEQITKRLDWSVGWQK